MENEENRINQEMEEMTFAEDRDFDLIFFIPDGVQLYTIDGGEATSPTVQSSLQILKYPEGATSSATPTALIQVGSWLYPLNKDTPVLFSQHRTFVVPNPVSDRPNLHVGIVLTKEVEVEQVEELSNLLAEFASLHEYASDSDSDSTESKENEKLGRSQRITNYLVDGGERIAVRIQTRAARMNQRIVDRAERYRTTVKPTDSPTHLPAPVKGGVEYMHKGTKVVARFTDRIFEKIGDVGTAVGKRIAVGTTKLVGDNETAGKSIKMVGGGVAAGGTVLFSLVIASKTLIKSFSTQTVENVKHKYGEEASETARHALHAAGHGGSALLNIHQITPQGVIGRVGMGAGVKTVSDLHVNVLGVPIPMRIPGMGPQGPVVQAIEEEKKEVTEVEEVTIVEEEKPKEEIEILKRQETLV